MTMAIATLPRRLFAGRALSSALPATRRLLAALLLPAALAAAAQPQQPPVMLDQGDAWTAAARRAFYGQDQGSQIMPLRWMAALRQPDGRPFLADSLGRYGYLPNPDSEPPGLPVGFTAGSSGPNGPFIGMTCSACHTRQIEVAGVSYRADGGPGIVDFQSFLSGLDQAVQAVLDKPAAFKDFAAVVLGPKAPPPKLVELRAALAAWHLPYHTLMERALPTPAWGPSRLDAVAMIFNRLAGLDLGPPPTYLIAENIQRADAPVRYPFLWNAALQDKTQWPGFADNGSPLLGLSRNLGEVFGVFASFKPRQDYWKVLGVDYLHENSADFGGLRTQEELIGKIGAPKWPWAVDIALAVQGEAIFARSAAQGGCVDCHGVKPGVTRFPDHKTWATPVLNVGTDTREYAVLGRQVKTGSLLGAKIPFLIKALKPEESAISVLGTAVLGSILQHYAPLALDADLVARAELSRVEGAIEKAPSSLDPRQVEELRGAFRVIKGASSSAPPGASNAAAPVNAYEARVLQGIWVAAPYLHNGSVPTLAELLKPASQRVSEFKIGPNYDLQNVGLAVEQSKFNYVLKTTDCSKLDSGNSRCGHEFGTSLPADEKKALLEYLKTL
jgi:hypothetical protein